MVDSVETLPMQCQAWVATANSAVLTRQDYVNEHWLCFDPMTGSKQLGECSPVG
jgi:hypothetical protein